MKIEIKKCELNDSSKLNDIILGIKNNYFTLKNKETLILDFNGISIINNLNELNNLNEFIKKINNLEIKYSIINRASNINIMQ